MLLAVESASGCGNAPVRLSADATTGSRARPRRLAIVVLGSGVNTHRADGRNISTAVAAKRVSTSSKAAVVQGVGESASDSHRGIADASVQREREADVLSPILQAHGVPVDRIILERRANTTYTQAVEVAIIAKARGFRKLVVVTSPAHLRRAVPASSRRE